MADIRMTRDLFLWCMSAIYLFAFASLYVQIPGLYGDNGILPARLVIQSDVQSVGELTEGNQPTLLRLLHILGLDLPTGMDFLTLAGLILSFCMMLSHNLRNSASFATLWVLYFSMYQVGQTFLWFQWDILLLEAGFLTVLVAPVNLLGLLSASYHQHDVVTMWLVRWLLFRLMFASGIVKLTSMCPTWWGLTAMNYHYETQCLPTGLAWYFHQMPEWFHKLSVVSVYVIEIAIPFLFFSPVRGQRIFAFWSQILLMVLIIITGNYNFFNLLTCVLCLSLVDDNFLSACLRKKHSVYPNGSTEMPLLRSLARPMRWTFNVLVYGGLLYWTIRLFALQLTYKPFSISSKITFTSADLDNFIATVMPITIWMGAIILTWLILSSLIRSVVVERGFLRKTVNVIGSVIFGMAAAGMFSISLVDHTVIDRQLQQSLWPPIKQWHAMSDRYQITSSYGLFRRMTGVGGRPEVIVEGSNFMDKGWKEYNFLHKPGNVSWTPTFVAPHQPRLDWQMWFAALGSYQHNPWFLNLAYRLLNNQPEVLELMGENPFPTKPPKYIRAGLYHYHFTSLSHQKQEWWERQYKREYLPVLALDEPTFITYLRQAGIFENVSPEDAEQPNLLKSLLLRVREMVGQPDGFSVCLAFFFTALTLGFLDPTFRAHAVS